MNPDYGTACSAGCNAEPIDNSPIGILKREIKFHEHEIEMDKNTIKTKERQIADLKADSEEHGIALNLLKEAIAKLEAK